MPAVALNLLLGAGGEKRTEASTISAEGWSDRKNAGSLAVAGML